MIAKRTLVASIVAVLFTALPIVPGAQSSLTNERPEHANLKALPGSWAVQVSTPTQGTFPALATFTSDGAVITSEASSFETAGHGNWVSTGDDEAAYTFVAIEGSPTGEFTGSLKVVATLRLDGRQKWSGPFKVDVFDADGNTVFSDRGTAKATRIRVERLD